MQGLLHTVGGGVSMSEVLVFFFFWRQDSDMIKQLNCTHTHCEIAHTLCDTAISMPGTHSIKLQICRGL